MVDKIDAGQFELEERLIGVNRVMRVRKGGRTPSFNAVTAVGNRDGIVGLGFAGANEVPSAIAKSLADAKKNLIRIPLINGTIPHEIVGKYKACNVLLKPAGSGTGVIAGGAARQVLEVAGIKDILAKSLGSPTHLNVAKATLNGLLGQRTPDEVAKLRGKNVMEIAPKGLVDAYENTKAERKLREDAKG